MGLDMYLTAKQYIGGWDHSSESERKVYDQLEKIFGVNPDAHSPHFNVEACVGYWRKANQVHAWFVRNCQDGKDECQDAYVSREKLNELLGVCEKVLAGKIKPKDGLPTEGGFFFGSTEYDEYYKKDLKDTIEIIKGALAMSKDWEFHYRASW